MFIGTRRALLNRNKGGGVFTPAEVFQSLEGLWLDFSDSTKLFKDTTETAPAVATSDIIRRAVDKSGYGYHAQASADASSSTLKLAGKNGKSVSTWDGSGHTMTIAKKGLSRNASKLTIFGVSKYARDKLSTAPLLTFQSSLTSAATVARARLGIYSYSRPSATVQSPDSTLVANNVYAIADAIDATAAPNEPFMLQEAIFEFALGRVEFYKNGKIGGFNFFTPGNSTDADESQVNVGGVSGTTRFKGDMCELIAVRGDLTDALRLKIYDYLSQKWAITYETPTRYNPQAPLPGAWTWFNDPRVLALSTTHFVAGSVQRNGSVLAGDLNAGVWTHRMLLLGMEQDDHDNAAHLRRASDGKLLAFFVRHGVDSNYYVAESTNADDATSWAAPVNIGASIKNGATSEMFTYANPIQLSGESGRIYNFFRNQIPASSIWAPYYTYTDDATGLAGWQPSKRLLNNTRPYVKVRRNGTSRIDFFVTGGHPDDVTDNGCYHFYYQGGNLYKTDGTLIGAIGSGPYDQLTQLSQIWDGSTAAGRGWTMDMVIVSGIPTVLLTAYPGATGDGTSSANDHRYRQGRWNGSAWATEEICAAGGRLYTGQPFYCGGAVTDPQNIDVVYCSRQVDGSGAISISGVHQLFKAERVSAGNWTLTQLTFGTAPCFRPYIPDLGRTLFYVKGTYTSYTDFDTNIETMAI